MRAGGENCGSRSIDLTANKEYNYQYEEGKLTRADECNVVLSGEIVTAKTVVNTVKYYYNSEGELIRKVITPADSTARPIYYETNHSH